MLPWALALLFFARASGASGTGRPISLHPERARYLLGEPVYLRMDGIQGRPPALEENTLVLAIRDPDGSERIYHTPLRFRARPAAHGSVPGARYARLIAEGGGWVFPKPGRYLLHLQAFADAQSAVAGINREGLPVSDTAAVEMAAPSDPADRRAWGIISRAPGEYAMAVYLEGGDQLRQGMGIIRELAAFPNAYRRTAAFVLSSDWAQDYLARGSGEPRPLDLSRALAFARWDKDQGLYVALRTAFSLKRAITLRSARAPGDSALISARSRLRAFEDSLTPDERALLASF